MAESKLWSHEIPLDESVFSSLKGKNVVFTGGASGIGRSAVTLFAQAGANITFGDIDKVEGDKLAASLGPNVTCQKTDVANWESLKELFAAATAKYGAPDIVCANAGIHEKEDWLSLEYLEKDSSWPSIQINFVAVLNTIKLALLSFRQSGKTGSIVLTEEVSGYEDTAPVCAYGGTKHAVVGLLRAFKTIVPVYNNSRINSICPWMVNTTFAGEDNMRLFGELPLNSPEGCARAILFAAADERLHGCGLWVAGDRMLEVERPYEETRRARVGEEMAGFFEEGWRRLTRPYGKDGEWAKLH